ncbi:MAG: hypothetical protein L3J30_09175 [Marinosulfonomonas sp.]|nr:hypothetical protein [Marinosulfonomonas sp.]
MATPIGQAYVTRSMAEYGESAVAGMAIIGQLIPVAFGVIFALSGTIGPIIGQNYGAGRIDRVQQSVRDGLIFTALVIIATSTILIIVRGPVITLFNADGITAELIILFCGPLALAWFFNGVIFVSNAAFNNLGRPFISTWINWGRHTLGTIPFVILGGMWFGPKGVLIGQAVGGVVFAIIALVMLRRVFAACTADDTREKTKPFQRHTRLMQIFNNRR